MDCTVATAFLWFVPRVFRCLKSRPFPFADFAAQSVQQSKSQDSPTKEFDPCSCHTRRIDMVPTANATASQLSSWQARQLTRAGSPSSRSVVLDGCLSCTPRRAFRLVAAEATTHGCGTAPDSDRLSPSRSVSTTALARTAATITTTRWAGNRNGRSGAAVVCLGSSTSW